MFYSQFKQDKFLYENVFKDYKFGIFVDIGAHDGITINNTLYFEKEHKWNGYNIEPNKSVYEKLLINRPNSININCAICDNDGESEFIHNEGYTEMISGLKSSYDERHLTRLEKELSQFGGTSSIVTVVTKKFSTLCKEYNIKYINYLSIDVEGAEFNIIKSIDFNIVFIDIIEFENNYSNISDEIVKYLQDRSYIVLTRGADIIMIHMYSKFRSK